MKSRKGGKGLLLLKDHNEQIEMEFDLEYLLSLSLKQRFQIMLKKSQEMKELLYNHDQRRPFEIIKRK